MISPEQPTKDFIEELNKIDADNLAFFLVNKPETKHEVKDQLKNHYRFELINNVAYFGFHDDSDLPNYIRKKCFIAFDRFFPEGKFFGDMFNH